MNIAILTFSKENNYGANLQCYALSKVLENLGHSVRIIDYQLPRRYSKNPIYNLYQYIQLIKFKSFRDKYFPPFTRKYTSKEELVNHCPKADCYIVGSDQVWNPDITRQAGTLTYFFDFLPDDAKRISYAASFGIDDIEKLDNRLEVEELLKKFEALSVREHTGVELCNRLIGVKPVLALDPTLLLGDFSAFTNNVETNRLNTFFFNQKKDYYAISLDIADRFNAEPYILGNYKRKKGFSNISFCGVEQWLNSLANSRFVLTDSFHCTVFSILYHRNFIVFNMPGKSNRALTLLKELNLEHRLCLNMEDYNRRKEELTMPIDFSAVDEKMEVLKSQSLQYLIDALK
ncbi:MAG: polysaccharide pyruvyl transferase family protein [Prevotella sp.]|uniref:polysaccharide pyruvyl transferase family protein n=1 Tax=Prevotella sp. TaxID=59823 RepID=UPI002A292BCC|nr:polysaccharide pyruvyl transferase family protein [Prevotella sp.]MDD7317918.1 polysaccharide pyruvyl transferase family protein [Prevotellaceae bacterium]MDY4020809.1 polysaccharide pyruvyl transferase family protein [Prevotella sp.]